MSDINQKIMLKLRNILDLGDIQTIRKGFKDSIVLLIVSGALSIVINYAKTNSTVFLYSTVGVILIVGLFGVTTIMHLKKDRRIFLIFKSVSLLAVSGFFLSICLTSYYVYLGFEDIIFAYVLVFSNILIAVATYRVFRRILTTSTEIKKDKVDWGMVSSLAGGMGGIGYIMAMVLLKYLDQMTIYIISIVLTYLISCLLLMCSSIYLLKYRLMREIGIR